VGGSSTHWCFLPSNLEVIKWSGMFWISPLKLSSIPLFHKEISCKRVNNSQAGEKSPVAMKCNYYKHKGKFIARKNRSSCTDILFAGLSGDATNHSALSAWLFSSKTLF